MPFVRPALCLLLASLFLPGLFAEVSGAASRPRGLERLLDGSGIDEAGRDLIAKSYGAALKAGQDKKETLLLVEVCLEGEFQPHQTARLLSLFAQLELAGLPGESFLSKVREGVAKGAEPEKIVAAAERRALTINRAKRLLDGLVLENFDVEDKEDLLPAVAEALELGKSESEIRTILISSLEEGDGLRRIGNKLLR